MTSPDRSPRWTRTGLPVPGRLDLLPRLDYEGRLRGPGGPEPAVTLAWLGVVDGPLPVGAVDAVGDVASGWNQVLARVVGAAVVDRRGTVWVEPEAGWLLGDSPELAALRAACLAALAQVVPVPAQPEPWQALVPTGGAWFPGGPPPAPEGEVLFDRLRLRWGDRAYSWRLLG